MKIMITDGEGFIGNNLVDHFLAIEHYIMCFNNISNCYEHNISHHFN
jgi:nucleoside-diphosphate-sugar epimerase